MKIAILHSAFTIFGGAERVIFNQAEGLRSRGHDVCLLGSMVDYENIFHITDANITIRPYFFNMHMPKLRLSLPLSTSLIFSSIVSRKIKDYDVVLCHHEPASWIAYKAWKRYHIPYVCYMHHPPRFIYPRPIEKSLGWGYDFDRRIIEFFGRSSNVLKKIDYVAISHARAVLTNSRRTAKEIKEIYGIVPIVCYPGVKVNSYRNVMSKSNILGKYKITEPFILMICRHTPHKRLDWLLEVFKKVSEENPYVTLVVIGTFHPRYTPKILELTNKLGLSKKVSFINSVPDHDLPFLYRKMSLYLHTAPNEDFGLGPLEAMANGAPVVVWDEAGPGEITINDITGFKVTPYILEDFAQKVIKLLSDDKLRLIMGRNAVEYAQEKFSAENHINILERHLKKAASIKCL